DHHGILAVVLDEVSAWAADHGVDIGAVGHRIVHGGESFAASVVLDDAALAAVRACIPLAPRHNPANIAGVQAAQSLLPDVPHVGVFDTAFHQSMPPVAYRYAVPRQWYDDLGVRRYGFHGTSHLYVSEQAAHLLGREPHDPSLRIVTAHLGNGCSLAAVKGGASIDTSMGLTPLEGLVMGTRSGDLDPGILGYLADRTGVDVAAVTDDLNKRSGLLGLSGVSNDMRELSAAAAAGDEMAQLAREVFGYRLAKYIASLVVPLEGLDALAFTGGIGENDVAIRARVIERLQFLGLRLDAAANDTCAGGRGGVITHGACGAAGPVALVVPTDEELVIARDAARLTSRPGRSAGLLA
ncbi:MAG: acetate kinase, partial [Micrococcales bacterium]|nr:acetate kinase [Micrococcales bacterium]